MENEPLSVAGQCFNYIVTAKPLLFCEIEKFVAKAGGENSLKRAQDLYQEVNRYGLTRLSFATMKDRYFTMPVVQNNVQSAPPINKSNIIDEWPKAQISKLHWKKIKIPKFGKTDRMVRLENNTSDEF